MSCPGVSARIQEPPEADPRHAEMMAFINKKRRNVKDGFRIRRLIECYRKSPETSVSRTSLSGRSVTSDQSAATGSKYDRASIMIAVGADKDCYMVTCRSRWSARTLSIVAETADQNSAPKLLIPKFHKAGATQIQNSGLG